MGAADVARHAMLMLATIFAVVTWASLAIVCWRPCAEKPCSSIAWANGCSGT